MASSSPRPVDPDRSGHRRSRLFPSPWARSEKGGRVFIRWRIFITYLAVTCLLLWAVATNCLYFFVRYRSGYPEVRYSHIVGLPWTLKDYRKEKAEFFVEQGLAAAREGRWRDAFDQLRIGLPDASENQEARFTLTRIYLMAGRPDMARTVLVEGLDHNANKVEYLRTVLGFLFGQQADQAIVELANHLMAQETLGTEPRRLLAIARSFAYFNRDHFEAAKTSLAADHLSNSTEGQFIEACIAWETGLRESALIQLRAVYDRAPEHAEIYRAILTYLRDSGRQDEARRFVLARRLAFPNDPEAYVDYISLCSEANMPEAKTLAQEDFIRQFKEQPSSLIKLSALAAKQGWPDVAWAIAAMCSSSERETNIATLQGIEAEIVRGSYNKAVERAREVADQLTWQPAERIILTGLEGVALFGGGMDVEGADIINRVLAAPAGSASSLATLGKYLRQMDKIDEAARLLNRAIELDSLYQPALVELLRLERDRNNLGNVLELIKRLPTMRKPPAELIDAITNDLESDQYLFLKSREEVLASLRQRTKNAQGISGIDQGAVSN